MKEIFQFENGENQQGDIFCVCVFELSAIFINFQFINVSCMWVLCRMEIDTINLLTVSITYSSNTLTCVSFKLKTQKTNKQIFSFLSIISSTTEQLHVPSCNL